MTQDLDLASISLADSSGNNSQSTDLNDAIWEPVSSGALVSPPTSPLLNGEEIDSQLQDTVIETTDDTEMLGELSSRPFDGLAFRPFKDVETQINPFVDPHQVDSIESYGRDVSVDDIEADLTTPKPRQKTKVDEQIDNGLRCECSISVRVSLIRLHWAELTPSRSRMHVVSVKEDAPNGITSGLFCARIIVSLSD